MMKKRLLIVMFMIVGLLYESLTFGQERFTPYDELPTITRSDKPAYSSDYPDWAKMLYSYPVNFNEINSAFEKYMKEHKGAKNPIIRYYKIWRRTVSSFAKDDGTIQMPDLAELNKAIRQEQLNAKSSLKGVSLSNSNWTFLGPKETFWLNSAGSMDPPGSCPWQANVYALDVAPSNSSILYVGTETGLVNKSTDKGRNWQLLGQDYPFGGAGAVAIHPTNPDKVYVCGGNKIHLSEDGGYNWAPILPLDNLFGANQIKINPDNPAVIVASGSGIFFTDDGGANWSKKYTRSTWDVEFKPGSSDTIYSISEGSTGYYEFIWSTNGGLNFEKVTSFPTNIKESSGGLLAVTQANPNVVYVTMLAKELKDGTEQGVPFIYKGVFDGTDFTWTRTKKGVVGGGLGDFSNGQGYFDLVLDVSPVNENLVFWGTCSLWKSTNGGVDYIRVGGYGGDYSIHPDIQSMRMLSNGDTWVATDGGINYTTDNFSSEANYHVRIRGLIGSDMWGFDQGWNEDIIVGGRYHNGNTAIADFYGDKALRMGGAESPTGWVLQGKSRHVAFNDLGNGWILPKTAGGAPQGRFVFSKYPNMDEYGGRRSNLLHHPNYYDILYLGEGNIFWRSMDGGVNFDLLKAFPGRVMYMEISHTNPDVIYVDIGGYGLFRSADGGVTWERKNSLTSGGSYGSPSWNGKLFLAISPYDEDVIYACLSNGTWSADIGKVYRSSNGGDTWVNWTSGLSVYMKSIVIQPTTDGVDLVYLLNTSKNGKPGSVYYRRADETTWTNYGINYPAGMRINRAMPFYRDSKLRVGGSASVWESPMQEDSYTPIINLWCQKKHFDCTLDTVYFDDHSILNHDGATWHWEFYPTPEYMTNPDERQVAVQFGDTIAYDVTLTVTKDGQEYTKTIPEMVSFSPCPTINDCNNPAELPKNEWTLLYFDSENPGTGGYASNTIDGDPATYWHTQWQGGVPDYPHEIQVDLGDMYMVHEFTYLPRQDGASNGTIKEYELYVSEDKTNWGAAVSSGSFESNTSPKTIKFDEPPAGKYFKFKALSEINDQAFASAAEFTIVGCYKPQTGIFDNTYSDDITAFPVPTNGKINLTLFTNAPGQDMKYSLYSVCGQVMEKGLVEGYSGNYTIDLSPYSPGIYFIILGSDNGTKYRVKVVKK